MTPDQLRSASLRVYTANDARPDWTAEQIAQAIGVPVAIVTTLLTYGNRRAPKPTGDNTP